jgi:hypothetical protein
MSKAIWRKKPTAGSLRKHAFALGELTTYITDNVGHVVNYGERFRTRERISTAFVESAINQIVDKRCDKRQSMRWTPRGAHLLLQTRTRVLNGDLDQLIRRRYPAFKRPQPTGPAPFCDGLIAGMRSTHSSIYSPSRSERGTGHGVGFLRSTAFGWWPHSGGCRDSLEIFGRSSGERRHQWKCRRSEIMFPEWGGSRFCHVHAVSNRGTKAAPKIYGDIAPQRIACPLRAERVISTVPNCLSQLIWVCPAACNLSIPLRGASKQIDYSSSETGAKAQDVAGTEGRIPPSHQMLVQLPCSSSRSMA